MKSLENRPWRRRVPGKPRPRRRVAAAVGSTATLAIVGTLAMVFARAPHSHGMAGGSTAVAVPTATQPWTPERMESATPAPTPSTTPPTTARPSTTTARPSTPSPRTTPSASQPSASPQATTTAAPPPVHAALVRPAPATAMTPYPRARTFDGTPAVGMLFYNDRSMAAHYCSASVVHSPGGDVVITAGHCVYGSDYKSGFAFVPGYHDGESPYGQWTPAKTFVTSAWRSSNDPDEDVAFLVMNKSSAGQTLESVVGANQIGFDQGFDQLVTVPAYPEGASSPITCTDVATEFSATQLRWDCAGYPGGTSGAPFLVGGNPGTVVGVIGGYETGGDSPDVSYSSYFGGPVARLYQQAVAAG